MNWRKGKTPPAFENAEISIYLTEEGLRIRRKQSWQRPLGVGLALAGVAAATAIAVGGLGFWRAADPRSPASEDFRLAVNKAMSAAQLTQAARSREEWETVAVWWQDAGDLMDEVPTRHPQYALAQAKVQEYQRNRNYARRKAADQPLATEPTTQLWTLGTTRDTLLRIQGTPTRIVRYDSLCKEVFYYKSSKVDLRNGYITGYDDLDNNLLVADGGHPPKYQSSGDFWTLGSSREEVLKVQGTPTQLVQDDALRSELLYYDNSLVELQHGVVTSYRNFDQNLKVVVAVPVAGRPVPDFWTLDSPREEILRVQGTPTQVLQNDALCQETVYYNNSSIQFKNGAIVGYDNLSRNLKIR
ncbi:hypothetical protein [Geitlerinema sp. PCC 7407]|uniref:hypothetical protein n=1 Tax=Geitlerinema sp. PCC 7407 TaxID=1173025 RepID=UPI00029FCAF0|nr:hypothetical protein [Geitlerinema sp. PCC 7407]AFY64864.1 hypothetical protein GEI7407_0363 [Geitlerinema sp. PCC 7407]